MSHSRSVTHDGRGNLIVRFPFDRALVDLVKTLPGRRWNAADRHWRVPEGEVVAVVDLLAEAGFAFDEATGALYRACGGHRALTDPAPAGGATLPGLFDDGDDDAPVLPGPAAVPTADDLTVSGLNERVRALIDGAFPAAVWLVGEISGFNKNVHRRHVGFELVERGPTGAALSKVPATLFAGNRAAIESALREAGDPFRLEDEISVRLLARVELYVPWGQYRVVVEGIDVAYTLGEAARRREEIVRRLVEAGLTERNRSRPLPPLPLRVGLITSVGSDAANDVLRTLAESGFAFDVTVHGARVQGHSTEPSVLNALDWFGERAGAFDVVLICRGGGSRTDLVWFDSEPLGRAVADFPLPVVVGIGHEQDVSVLDAVARSAKTPTAAAALLVQTVGEALRSLVDGQRALLRLASRRLRDEDGRTAERTRRLLRGSRLRLDEAGRQLAQRRRRTVIATRAALAAARSRLARWTALIPRGAAGHLARQRMFVRATLRALGRAARRDLVDQRRAIGRLAAGLGPSAARIVGRETERAEGRGRRLRLVDPQRVLDRGYAILRRTDGAVVVDAAQVPAGAALRARLRRGTLGVRSEGALGDDGAREGGGG